MGGTWIIGKDWVIRGHEPGGLDLDLGTHFVGNALLLGFIFYINWYFYVLYLNSNKTGLLIPFDQSYQFYLKYYKSF